VHSSPYMPTGIVYRKFKNVCAALQYVCVSAERRNPNAPRKKFTRYASARLRRLDGPATPCVRWSIPSSSIVREAVDRRPARRAETEEA
jgi:hypothetical protein